MKTLRSLVITLALLVLYGGAQKASAAVSFEFFYDNLDPYGEWIEVADYGYAWRPASVDEGWAPYTDGYWAYTDGGWTWVSYEDFGGITYHYGRWTRLEDEGWCWVPDYEWAPAWVSWRSSDDHIGWAPLPPRARITASLGIGAWADVEFDIGPGYYNFCEYRHFGEPALRPVILDRSRNVTIINNTRNITNITVNKTKNVFVGGPSLATVSQKSARKIQRLKLKKQTDVAAMKAGGGKLLAKQEGNELVVAAPEVTKADPAKVKPAKVARKLAAAKEDRGWNAVKDPEEKQKLQAKLKTEVKGREKAPAKAEPVEALTVDTAEAAPQPDVAAPAGGKGKGKGKGKQGGAAKLTPDTEAPDAAATGEIAAPQGAGKKAKGQAQGGGQKKKQAGEPLQPFTPGAQDEDDGQKKKAKQGGGGGGGNAQAQIERQQALKKQQADQNEAAQARKAQQREMAIRQQNQQPKAQPQQQQQFRKQQAPQIKPAQPGAGAGKKGDGEGKKKKKKNGQEEE